MTVTDLLSKLVDVTDRGLYVEDDFVSWSEHLRRSAQRARAIAELLTPGRPPHVGVLMSNVAEFSYAIAAAALGQFVVVGLNTTRRGAALAADIATADCDLVLTCSDTHHLLDSVDHGARVINVDSGEWPALLAPHGDTRVDLPESFDDDLLMLIFTSGTTGDPKAVRCTHRTFAAGGTMLAERFDIGPTDNVYLSMPLFHSNATIAGWSVAVAGTASITVRRKFSASSFLPDVRRFGITYANYVGKPLNYILATPEEPDDAENPLRIVYGNEASASDRRRFAARFGCRVVDGFGSTEGGVAITRTPDTPDDALGPLRPPTAVVDPDTGASLPAGEVGEIVNSSGPGLFSGYYRNREATAERMRGGVYHTGDLGWVDDAGYVHFAGRLGEWMRVDGENLCAGPIERILLRHNSIRQAAVYGVPTEIGDEIEAVLVAPALGPDEFGDFLAAQTDLGPKQWPHRVRVVDSLPETATFKTLTRTLRENSSTPTWTRRGRTYR